MIRSEWRWAWVLAVGALAALPVACGDGATAPDQGVPEEELRFLVLPPDLRTLETRDTSFWAVRGQDTRFEIRYVPEAGQTEGDEFLTFRIRSDGLYRRPSGQLFADGDSIQIHVTVADDGRFLFDFQPSGLRFDPDSPAELEVEYERLGGDLDGDGDTDADDAEIEQNLRLWRQEAPGELWYPIGTIRFEELDELRGEIEGFTGFAVAI